MKRLLVCFMVLLMSSIGFISTSVTASAETYATANNYADTVVVNDELVAEATPQYSNSWITDCFGNAMYNNLTTHYTKAGSRDDSAIDTISIHCMAAPWSAKTCADYFASTEGTYASAQYCVGYDGSVAQSVSEAYRSYCTSSYSNDIRAVTIEVGCDTTHPYYVPDVAIDTLVKLCVDICQRNNIKRLLWEGNSALIGDITRQNMTVHRWFAAKACPGDYLYNKHWEIAERVNTILLGGEDTETNPGNPLYTPFNVVTPEGAIDVEDYVIKTTSSLRVRTGPGTTYEQQITETGAKVGADEGNLYTICWEYTDSDEVVWGKLSDGTGWIALTYTEKVEGATPEEEVHVFAVGDVVSIKQGAVWYNTDKTPSDFIFEHNWIIKSITGDRAVLGNSADGEYADISSPISIQYLNFVSNPDLTPSEPSPEPDTNLGPLEVINPDGSVELTNNSTVKIIAETPLLVGPGEQYAQQITKDGVKITLQLDTQHVICWEFTDANGNIWGRISDGSGWVNLANTQKVSTSTTQYSDSNITDINGNPMYKNLSTHYTKAGTRDGAKIDTISIHAMIAVWTGKRCADYFSNESLGTYASSQYCVGYDGSVAQAVSEEYRSYCTSSASNDKRAVTIETASEMSYPFEVTDEAIDMLVKLCIDICERNEIKKLLWQNDEALIGNVEKQNMTVHMWFANKDCPGPYLLNKHYEIADRVNHVLAGGTDPGTGWTSNNPATKGPIQVVTPDDAVDVDDYIVKTTSSISVFTGPGTSYQQQLDTQGNKVNVEAGNQYTICWEYTDSDGLVWGRLGNGNGWICLNYTEKVETTPEPDEFEPYTVKVNVESLNVYSGPGTNYTVNCVITDMGNYTIVAESAGQGSTKGWGQLKSGVGWINLDDVISNKPVVNPPTDEEITGQYSDSNITDIFGNPMYKNLTTASTKAGSRDGAKIDTITIHCMAAPWSAKTCADYFARTTETYASANYCVGYDGSLAQSVSEQYRTYATSSADNDRRAITIEVGSDTVHPYYVPDEAIDTLVKLLVDICERNNIEKLLWKNDSSLIGDVSQQNMTIHRWFVNKECPGDYLLNKHYEIAERVNTILAGGSDPIEPEIGPLEIIIPEGAVDVTDYTVIATTSSEIFIGPANTYRQQLDAEGNKVYTTIDTQYTIAQEYTDDNGVIWGLISDNSGWINLASTKPTETRTYTESNITDIHGNPMYKNLSNHYTKAGSRYDTPIDTITLHTTLTNWTAKQIADYFSTTSIGTYASSQYCVGYDGSVAQAVSEKYRSFDTSSGENDRRAITIEIASDATNPYYVTDDAIDMVVKLLVDICQRNNIPKLLWKNDSNLIGDVSQQNMTVHRWFASKACPGDYLLNKHYEIADRVNAILAGESDPGLEPVYTPYDIVLPSGAVDVEDYSVTAITNTIIKCGPGAEYQQQIDTNGNLVNAIAGNKYTICWEFTDVDGTVWGLLTDGTGWVNLADVEKDEETVVEYTITFVNYDGTILSSTKYQEGDTVIAPSAPSRPSDVLYSYTFIGWDKEVVICKGDATYTAQFTSSYIEYKVTFLNYDGKVLSAVNYHYGDTVVEPSNPIRPSNQSTSYTFIGWDKEVVECTENATYTAQYREADIVYFVNFLDYDGSTISTQICFYGDEVIAPTPTRQSNETYTYEFIGWDKEVVACVGNATYTAQYKTEYTEYTVIFKDYDGTVLSSDTYHYGDTVVVPSNPTRPSTESTTYNFIGWDKEVVNCNGNATYTALYRDADIVYFVNFLDYDGSTISTQVCFYGDEVIAPTPTRQSNETYTYEFIGWDKEVVACVGNATYTAQYLTEYVEYTVTFEDYDGKVLSTATYHFGDMVVVPNSPTRPSNNGCNYVFAGWDREVVACVGNATYTAQYTTEYIE